MTTAHLADPITSYIAADAAQEGAQARKHREALLGAVLSTPGLTSAELARETGLDRHAAARRLPEIERDGRIRKGPIRKCSVGGRPCVTWTPPLGSQAALL